MTFNKAIEIIVYKNNLCYDDFLSNTCIGSCNLCSNTTLVGIQKFMKVNMVFIEFMNVDLFQHPNTFFFVDVLLNPIFIYNFIIFLELVGVMLLTPKGRERPNQAFLILGRFPKLDNRPDSCEIFHNRVLPRILANKTIFIKNT